MFKEILRVSASISNNIVLAHAGIHGAVAQLNRSMGPRVREDDVVLRHCCPFCNSLVRQDDTKKKGLKITLQAFHLTNFWCGWQELNPRPLGS